MKKVIPILATVSILAISCQSNDTSKTSSDSNLTKSDTLIKTTDCYEYTNKRDTANLTIFTSEDKVSGDLKYKFWEKDPNNGTIRGIVKGDTIIADYTFTSEGMESKRQVVWLKRENKLIEGFGEQEEVGKIVKFKNINDLKFAGSIEFNRVDCK